MSKAHIDALVAALRAQARDLVREVGTRWLAAKTEAAADAENVELAIDAGNLRVEVLNAASQAARLLLDAEAWERQAERMT